MMHARETQLTQAAHERETLLLQLMAQMQQQNQRLLDMPRSPSPPPAPPHESPPVVAHPVTPGTDPRGEMRQRIVALLQAHPEGLSTAEMRTLLGADRSLADTCLGMLRYGLVQRVGRGKYVAAAPLRHDHP
jgi:hypothetical protein